MPNKKNTQKGSSTKITKVRSVTTKTSPRVKRSKNSNNSKPSSIYHVKGRRELVCEVLAASSHTSILRYTNPGNATMFPWLSGIATSYDRYKFTKLTFHFIPEASNISSSGTLGTVGMAFLYDVKDATPATMSILDAYHGSRVFNPTEDVLMNVDLKKIMLQTPRYTTPAVTPTDLPLDSDSNLYYLGNFIVAVAGSPATAGQRIGRVEVLYDIEFDIPKPTDLSFAGASAPSADWLIHSSLVSCVEGDALYPMARIAADTLPVSAWEELKPTSGASRFHSEFTNVGGDVSAWRFTIPDANLGDVYHYTSICYAPRSSTANLPVYIGVGPTLSSGLGTLDISPNAGDGFFFSDPVYTFGEYTPTNTHTSTPQVVTMNFLVQVTTAGLNFIEHPGWTTTGSAMPRIETTSNAVYHPSWHCIRYCGTVSDQLNFSLSSHNPLSGRKVLHPFASSSSSSSSDSSRRKKDDEESAAQSGDFVDVESSSSASRASYLKRVQELQALQDSKSFFNKK